jgi:hypothetical protein
MDKSLSDILKLRRRFLRSVSLERDARSASGLEGYITTTTGLSALERIEGGVTEPALRAVTITGPYGTGKSAFALYMANKLCIPPVGTKEGGLFPVFITGGREPIIPALLNGLEVALYGQISFNENECTAKEVANRFTLAAQEVKERSCSGLLVIIDELGKFLEFAAQYPEKSDLQVLQEMAEMAVRSESESPVFLVTVLHQAFDEYAHNLSSIQKNEWQKVQGRFIDIPFGDNSEDSLRLIGQAFEGESAISTKRAKEQSKTAKKLKIFPRSVEDCTDIFAGAFALHPVTLLALPHLFKRFGQSERTLFSFLSSDDPNGLGTFLLENPLDIQYSIDRLYDYVMATLGTNLYSMLGYGKLWSQIQEAIYRCENLGVSLDARIVKTVGLLHLLGETARLSPSKELIVFALEDKDTSAKDITEALDRLVRSTILTFRQFKNAYRPYEGSDIDVEEQLKEAKSALGSLLSPASVALKRLPFSPIIARKHSFRTGALRFFEVKTCAAQDLIQSVDKGTTRADGLLLLCLTSDSIEQRSIIEEAKKLTAPEQDRSNIVIAVAKQNESLQESAFLVEALEWVRENTPQLVDDPIATREVQERLNEAFNAFEVQWSRLLLPKQETQFIWQGECPELESSHALQSLLSDACYMAYPHTPILRNELLNRRQLSSTAAASRRSLIEAMILRRQLPHLGIQGFPAERMMYETVLSATGLHGPSEDNEDWVFHPSVRQGDSKKLSAAWRFLEHFLLGGDLTPKSVNVLYAALRSRPFGLMGGVLPVFLVAALLCWEDELLLYESGVVIPQFDVPVAERLLKRPQDFSVLGVRIAGERQAVITRFSRGILKNKEKHTLVNVVKNIYIQLHKLPPYTHTTKSLTETATKLRDGLKEGRSPERLLFYDLPQILEVAPFTAEPNPENVEKFFQAWNQNFTEITNSYDRLLERLRVALLDAFEAEFIEDVVRRADALVGSVMEPNLVAFTTRLADQKLKGNTWLESVAASIVGRVPDVWTDANEAKYMSLLASRVKSFHDAEEVLFAMSQAQTPEDLEERVALRVSVASPGGQEDARVIIIPKREARKAEVAADKIRTHIKKSGLDGETSEVQMVTLAFLMRELLRSNEKGK